MAKASHSPRSSLADARSPRRIHGTTISSTSSSRRDLAAFFNSLLGALNQRVRDSILVRFRPAIEWRSRAQDLFSNFLPPSIRPSPSSRTDSTLSLRTVSVMRGKRFVQSTPRRVKNAHPLAGLADHEPVAVMLDLVDPAGADLHEL